MPVVNTPLIRIPFNQYLDVIIRLDQQKHGVLKDFVSRFGGLCELICNRILIDDSIGKGRGLNSLQNSITIERLDKEEIKSSHLLNVYSAFHRAIAFLFGIYPDNIFTILDQWKLVEKKQDISLVNREIFEKGLKEIKESEVLKFEVFSKCLSGFSGHSLLIKKISSNNYIFFDPDIGEDRGLSFCKLSDRIDQLLKKLNGTDIYLTKGDLYLKKLGIKA